MLAPPVPPMLARLEHALPHGAYLYEPKWDGFRCLASRDDGAVELQSRHGNPLGRYFPELVEALAGLPSPRFVLDGEIVPPDGDFPALMARLHPAPSRVERLREETPVSLVAFDLLAEGDEPLLAAPFDERRARPPLLLTPTTDDVAAAVRWLETHEGVLAKPRDLPYQPGRRAMVKVKRERTAECVVAGFRWRLDRPLPSSLLLGLYDETETLQHVGVAGSFGARQAEALLDELKLQRVPLEGHPWKHGFLLAGGALGRLRGAPGRWVPGMTMDWTPVAPELVAEVSYDRVDDGRFRHPARFRRWRPDREPRSCTLEQLG